MLNVIIVDDEVMAIERLMYLLKSHSKLCVKASFTNAPEAFDYVWDNRIDLIFLDINMPIINGLEFANEIRPFSRETKIVFITGYSEFAIEAFEVEAFDYLVKPVRKERLDKCLDRFIDKEHPEIIVIDCFGDFEIIKTIDGHEERIKWRSQKVKELFGIIYSHRGESVKRIFVQDLLWPDFDEKKGATNLNSTLYYLKKDLELFSLTQFIESNRNDISFRTNNEDRVECSLTKWHKIVGRLEKNSEKKELFIELLAIYKGTFLKDTGYIWSYQLQGQYERQFITFMRQYLLLLKRQNEKERVLKKIIDRVPHQEEFYQSLIMELVKANEVTEAKNVYSQLCANLKKNVGTKPSFDIGY